MDFSKANLCLPVFSVLLLLSACAARKVAQAPRSAVGAGMFLPLGAVVAEEQPHVKVLAPGEIKTPLPAFPATAPGGVDVTICAEIVVDTEGSVASIRQIAGRPECEPLDSKASAKFFREVAAVLRQWQFFAGGVCRFEVSEDECFARNAAVDRRAMKLAYFFHFARADGLESVSRAGGR